MVYTISISVWITSIDAHSVYIVLLDGGNEKDNTLVRVLINKIIKLKRL
jgi:hypothetical protein